MNIKKNKALKCMKLVHSYHYLKKGKYVIDNNYIKNSVFVKPIILGAYASTSRDLASFFAISTPSLILLIARA